jgi:hypothetical protein
MAGHKGTHRASYEELKVAEAVFREKALIFSEEGKALKYKAGWNDLRVSENSPGVSSSTVRRMRRTTFMMETRKRIQAKHQSSIFVPSFERFTVQITALIKRQEQLEESVQGLERVCSSLTEEVNILQQNRVLTGLNRDTYLEKSKGQ